MLARAGVPLRTSLERLRVKIPEREVAVLSQKLNEGEKLGDAFAAAQFSPFECHLVTAGERSAQLDAVFQHLSEFWSRQWQMRHALLNQLYYPLALLHFAIAVNALTALIGGSMQAVVLSFIEGLTILYVVGFVIFIVVRVTWMSDLAQGFWMRVPIIGSALATVCAYRWITALKLEFSAGIPLSNAVADAWRASGYAGVDRLAAEGETEIRSGTTLSTLIQRWTRLPSDWVDFIETGEISGALETALANLETEAARTWSTAQQRMTEWVPKISNFIIILIVGVMVFRMTQKIEEQNNNDLNDVQKQIDQATQ